MIRFCVLASILVLMDMSKFCVQAETLIVPCCGIELTNRTSILISSSEHFDCIVSNQNDDVVSALMMVSRCDICFPENKKIMIKGSFECKPDEEFVIYIEDINTSCIFAEILAFSVITSPIWLSMLLCVTCSILVILETIYNKISICYSEYKFRQKNKLLPNEFEFEL